MIVTVKPKFVEDVIQTKNGDFIVVGGSGGDPLTPSQIKG